jgi:hypothetical protein
MSSLILNQNFTYSMVNELLLVQLGSTYLIDSIYLSSSCVNVFGIILNIMGIGVLFNNKFKSIKLFDLMRIYLIYNTAICISLVPAFLIGRRFAFANEPYGSYYIYCIYAPIVYTCSVSSALIDVAILLDRITLFTRKFDLIKKISVRSICLISFIFGLLIATPYYAFFHRQIIEAYLSETVTLKFFVVRRTAFLETQFGLILYLTFLFLKDVVTVALVAAFNIVSIVLFKSYLAQRAVKFKMNYLNNKNNNTSKFHKQSDTIENNNSLQQTNSLVSAFAKVSASNNMPETDVKPQTSSNVTTQLNRKRKITNADKSATLMAIVLSLFSIFEHSLTILLNIFSISGLNSLTLQTGAILTLVVSINNSINFFVFYSFNKNFKNVVVGCLRKYF